MGLQPLDLQALFLHMNQPAKDQAVTRDAVVQSQNAQANKLVEQSLQTQNDVTPSTTEDEKELKVKDKEHHEFEKKEQKKKQQQESPQEAEQEKVFVDDRIGKKVNLTG
jgi:hypothetical protein